MIINTKLTNDDVKKVRKPIRFLCFLLFLAFLVTPISAFIGPIFSGATFLESLLLSLIVLAIFIIPIHVTYLIYKTGHPPKSILWMSEKK
jgi:hypothetical protein